MNTRKVVFSLLLGGLFLVASCTQNTAEDSIYEVGVDKTLITKDNKSVDKTLITKDNKGND